jgi:hypothetical protein
MPSTEFQELSQAIVDLKSGLMNFAARADGDYTPEELLKCRAFIAFAHAEVETYLEKVALRILEESYTRWNSNSVYDRVIATLLTFCRNGGVAIPDDPKNPNKKCVKEIVEEAFKTQRRAINENNGIKRKNLSTMLSPLGVLPEDLEEVFLIQLDNTGTLRGIMVHKASRVSLRNIHDPFTDEQQDIDNLLSEIGRFDAKLEALRLLSVPAAPPEPAVVSALSA